MANAYLAFGELFFNEAQGDPSKWALAEQSYGEVIKYPPPDNKVFGYAHYKLAYVYWNKGDFEKAIASSRRPSTSASSTPRSRTRRSSRTRRAATSSPSTPSRVIRRRPRLLPAALRRRRGRREDLQDDGRSRPELPRHRPLQGGHRALPGPHDPRPGAEVLHLPGAHRRGDARHEVRQQGPDHGRAQEAARRLREVRQGEHPEDAKLKCANVTAELLSETAMAWHLEAVGSGGVRGTGDKKTMEARRAALRSRSSTASTRSSSRSSSSRAS
jgi:hypothetical protein